VYTKRPRRHTA